MQKPMMNEKIGIVGAGLIGSAWAIVFARAGCQVALHDAAPQALQACQALLRYRFSAGYDCSTPGNRICPGVWTRQQARHAACMAAQS